MTVQEEIEIQAEKASEERAIDNAKNFLEMGLSPEKVAKGTSLLLKQVLDIQNKLQNMKS